MIRIVRVLAVIVLPWVSLNFSCASLAQSKAFQAGRRVGTIKSDLVREASGIVASRLNPGVLWIHNDSGDVARLFVVNARAEVLGICNIRGASLRDWEDIAIGPVPDSNRHCLYIGDIGDNRSERSEIIVYRVPEPTVGAATAFGDMTIGPAEAIRLTYPDGPRDAETLLLDPRTGDLYILSKRELSSKVYRAAFPQSTTDATQMEWVTALPWGFAVAGDVSPDGQRVIVRGMLNASIWTRPAGAPLWHAFSTEPLHVAVADEPQGEGICFDSRGAGYFTIGEMEYPPLYYFAPADPNAAPAR